jgi:hypothetical protein
MVKRSCPWCFEVLPVRRSAPECPHCGRIVDGEGEPKALELRFQRVERELAETYRRLLAWGTPSVAGVAIVMPLLHVGAVIAIPLVVLVHLVVVRLVLVREAQRLFGPVRRLLNRWTIRFAFLWLGLPGYGAMTVPVVGIALGTGTFVVLTTIAHVSTLVALQRERSRQPLSRWEKAVPIALAVVTVVIVMILIGLAVLFGWTVAAIAERMQAP